MSVRKAVGAGLYVADQRIGVRVEIGTAHNKSERAQLANHVAAAGAGLEDRAFDLDRTAERRDNPARVDSEVLVRSHRRARQMPP